MPLLLVDGHVVTMDGGRTVHDRGFVLVGDDGRIAAVGPMAACVDAPEARRIDCAGAIVLPGLIDLHTRPWTQLFPGSALGDTAAGRLTPDAHALAAALAAEAALASGVTTVVASLPQGTGADAAQMRSAFAQVGVHSLVAAHDPDGLETGDVLLVATDRPAWTAGRTSEASVVAAAGTARARGLNVMSHLWPIGMAMADMLAAEARIGRTSVQHLMELGVLEPGWLLVSPLGLSDMDRMLVAESGCGVVGLPVAEAAAGVGTTDLSALAQSGIACGLGTDGPGIGWTTDMIEQMKWAVMSQNTLSLDVQRMSAERALEMTTIGAARALGADSRIGALAPGMQADIAVFDLGGYHFGVSVKPISHFAGCARPADTRLVLKAGRPVLEAGRPRDTSGLVAAAQRWRRSPTPATAG